MVGFDWRRRRVGAVGRWRMSEDYRGDFGLQQQQSSKATGSPQGLPAWPVPGAGPQLVLTLLDGSGSSPAYLRILDVGDSKEKIGFLLTFAIVRICQSLGIKIDQLTVKFIFDVSATVGGPNSHHQLLLGPTENRNSIEAASSSRGISRCLDSSMHKQHSTGNQIVPLEPTVDKQRSTRQANEDDEEEDEEKKSTGA
ncbi:hypothetical protein AXG93_496s1090 [Marchantia polymorpha subsp. ruderalis]|uniref:Uncharacterized protein n=1 Tax=Marchantia polymorpha subsp. ruderalis TaxID=1480154 RepID=A0A176VPK4_MARPO|nr:hypothetical protein AXG93_496s1090 [Marchantia polymorpha subsp. ruderalis]